MTKHTPGPWALTSKYNNIRTAWTVQGMDKKSVCCCTSNSKRPADEIEANAYLVGASPELLAALKVSLAAMVQHCDALHYPEGDRSACRMAAAAIAKAEGRPE